MCAVLLSSGAGAFSVSLVELVVGEAIVNVSLESFKRYNSLMMVNAILPQEF
jgi:hypothetical protein